MTSSIALLRAVNVGGTGKLPMADLKKMCEAAGFHSVRTFIASGNVVFESRLDEIAVRKELEKRLVAYAGKPVGGYGADRCGNGRGAGEEPISGRAGQSQHGNSLDEAPPKDALDSLSGRVDKRWDWGEGKSTCTTARTWHGQSSNTRREKWDSAKHEHRCKAGRPGSGRREASLTNYRSTLTFTHDEH